MGKYKYPLSSFRRKFSLKRLFQILCFLIILFIYQANLCAEIRYVSKTGTSIPPYTSWETASDSIQKCINISSFGDTIYVGNGVYKEVIELIPGLALIGIDWDSTIIDTRGMLDTGFSAITFQDSCYLGNFMIIISGDNLIGNGITIYNSSTGLIENNKIFFGVYAITAVETNLLVRSNIINNSKYGVFLLDINKSVIENNLIINPFDYGIYIQVNASPKIISNIIKVQSSLANGIQCSFSFSSHIFNNLILGYPGQIGIESYFQDTIVNNVIYGDFTYSGIFSYGKDYTKNNCVITGFRGYVRSSTATSLGVVQYNNFWDNTRNFTNYAADSTNISFDPMFVNPDSLDFHLQMFSPLIDAGDPDILDKDGTSSDIGLYGGPLGESYIYKDLAPAAPKGLTVTVDSNGVITIKWKKNTEADFNHFRLFRDTISSFTADSTTLVGEFEDTLYSHITPPGIERFYYKLTAVDNQLNESVLSEEIGIILVSINEPYEIISHYQLFQNYPNPFNPSTLIPYRIKERSYVKLRVYNINGELVSTLVNETKEAGYYEVEFYGQSSFPDGDRFTSGIYLYKLDITGNGNIPVYSDMKKMIYLK